MFVGVSKNIGNGFRVGVGTRLSGGKKGSSSKELKTAEFSQFMNKVQDELNTIVATFIEANGHDFKKLMKEKTDLDELFANNENYDEFISRFRKAKTTIEKVLFAGDDGVVAKRAITDEIFELKEFIEKCYPGFVPTSAAIDDRRSVGILLGAGILFLPFIFSWFTLRKGHTAVARVVAFSWLVILLVAAPPQKNEDINKQTSAQSNSAIDAK